MSRKLLIMMLSVFILTLQPIQVFALEQVSAEPIIIDHEKQETIRELMDLRGTLCVDVDANKEQILKVDEQLKALGVEDLSAQEMAEKLGVPNASTMANPAPKTGVEFKSNRFITVWNGERYEIQEVISYPKANSSSPLKDSAVLAFESYENRVADQLEFLAVTVQGAYSVYSEFNPSKVGTVFNGVMTFYDVFSSLIDAIEPTTYISGIDSSATVNFSFYEKYVFIKCEGSADEGNQILAYCGNRMIYAATIVTPNDIMVDGMSYPINGVRSITEDYRAQYYDNYTSRAAQIFWNYRHNGVTNFNEKFWVYSISFEAIGDAKRTISIPQVGVVWR